MLPPNFLTIPQLQHERHDVSKLMHLTALLEYLLKIYKPNVTAACRRCASGRGRGVEHELSQAGGNWAYCLPSSKPLTIFLNRCRHCSHKTGSP